MNSERASRIDDMATTLPDDGFSTVPIISASALPPTAFVGFDTAIIECARSLGALTPTDEAYPTTIATMRTLLARHAPVRIDAGVIVDESQPVGRLQHAGDIAGVIIVMVMAGLILLSGSLWYEWGTPQIEPVTTTAPPAITNVP